jgi:nudix-type nucleoside diphosphatase (YffH/AdpP family)
LWGVAVSDSQAATEGTGSTISTSLIHGIDYSGGSRNAGTGKGTIIVNVELFTKKRIFDRFFKIDELNLRFERFNGAMTPPLTRLVFERGDSVAAVILNTDNRRLILTNQFKAPTYEKGPGWIIEIVAGIVDPGETPEKALHRELLEETGYRASAARPITTFYVSPGGSSERIFLYYVEVKSADRIAPGGGVPAEGEDIQLVELTLAEALTAVSSGEIMDAKTIIGLMWLKDKQNE